MTAKPIKRNTAELHSLINRECTIDFGSEAQGKFLVNAKITDARFNFGRIDVKLMPISGGGSSWFSKKNIKLLGKAV